MILNLLFQLFISSVVFAQEATPVASTPEIQCVCQIGIYPQWQRPLFRLGCQMWLNMQKNCTAQSIAVAPRMIEEDQPVPLPESVRGGELRLGYVGHWDGTVISDIYIRRVIVPTMRKYDVNAVVDNKGCSGLANPKAISILGQDPKLIPPGKILTYTSNQVYSIGMWERVLPGEAANFWAEVTLPGGSINYPRCKEFENKYCFADVEGHQSGTCMDSQGHEKVLSCCRQEDLREVYDGIRTNNWKWLPGKPCGP